MATSPDALTTEGEEGRDDWSQGRRLERIRHAQFVRLVTNRVTGAATVAHVNYAPGGYWDPTPEFLDAVALIHRELSKNVELLSFQMVFTPAQGGS